MIVSSRPLARILVVLIPSTLLHLLLLFISDFSRHLPMVTSVPERLYIAVPEKNASAALAIISSTISNLTTNRCFATTDAGATLHSSADATAVRTAIAAAPAGGEVRLAGYCAGATSGQVATIAKRLTLIGGYTTTNWANSYPITQPTTLDAQRLGRVIVSSAPVTLTNFTVYSGTASGSTGGGIMASANLVLQGMRLISNTSSSHGAGLMLQDAQALVIDSDFVGNRAGNLGGGILVGSGSALTLNGGTFQSNRATGNGGGIASQAGRPVTISNTAFISNRSSGRGGGLYLAGASRVSGAEVMSNSAVYGGGVWVEQATTLLDTRIVNNNASEGGGIRSSGNLTLTGVVVEKNTAGIGGGLRLFGASTVLMNSQVRNNSATNGGGAYIGSRLTLSSGAVISGNHSTVDGGGVYLIPGASSQLILNGGEIIGNTAGQDGGGVYMAGTTSVFTYTSGIFAGNSATQHGGGLYLENGILDWTTAATFMNNSASQNGGGLYALINLVLKGGVFSNNSATRGAGIYANVSAAISTTTFLSNRANGDGGGLFANGVTTLYNSQFIGNRTTGAGSGAGVWSVAGLTVKGGLFRENIAAGSGGGLASASLAPLSIDATQFIGNRSGTMGGALVRSSGPGRIVNSLFARNYAAQPGYAIRLLSGSPLEIIYSTITSPTLATGPAIYAAAGTLFMTDTIVANHSAAIEQTAAAVISEDYNLFDGNTTALVGTIASGGHSFTGTVAFIDPTHDDYHLTADSIAIDRGLDTGILHDVDGQARPLQTLPDLGYDERIGTPFCAASMGATTEFSSTHAVALRAAIAKAMAENVETVKVAGHCTGVAIEGGIPQVARITKPLTLVGGYSVTVGGWDLSDPVANPTILDALGQGRVIFATANLTVIGLTVANGRSTDNGGGIYATQGITLTDAAFVSNTTDSQGGGAYVVGRPLIHRTAFVHNRAGGSGGGLAANNGDGLLVQQSRFEGNLALDDGGALYLLQQDQGHFSANQFLRNQAASAGGALYFSSSQNLQLVNNLFAANESGNLTHGADIDLGGVGEPTLPSSFDAIHNTFVTAHPGQGLSVLLGGQDNAGQTGVFTNSLFADYAVGIQSGPNLAAVAVDGVLWSNVTTPTQQMGAGGAVWVDHTLHGAASFVNPVIDNYHLTSASVAVDMGVATAINRDFDDEARPQQALPDLGYDESPHPLPSIVIGDASVTEGDNGQSQINFPVTLSFAKAITVTIGYATSDLTALAGSDYQPTSGTILFAPGITNTQIAIPVSGDVEIEQDESFAVRLSSPGFGVITDGEAIGLIDTDDFPVLVISDAAVVEGNSGLTYLVFTATLDQPGVVAVSVNYATSDGSATVNDVDYSAVSDTLNFVPGETIKTINIPVLGDKAVEGDETLSLILSNVSGAILKDDVGVGVIGNDDAPPPFTFRVTVGIQGIKPECTNSSSLHTPTQTVVIYCYTIQNDSDQLLTTHHLVDEQWGVLLDTFIYPVAPGAIFSKTVAVMLTNNTINLATWSVGVSSNQATGQVIISTAEDDQDGDTIPDNVEGGQDLDQDNIPNFLDTDADNDGRPDLAEAGLDPTHPQSTLPGVPDFLNPHIPTEDDPDPTPGQVYMPLVMR